MTYLVLVSFVWAFSFPLIKGALSDLDSSFVSFARMLLSLVVFLPFLRITGTTFRDRLALIGIGAVQFGLMYVAYIATYRYLPAHLIALLTTTTPLFVTFINDIFSRKFHGAFFVSACLAVGAGAAIKYPDQRLAVNIQGVVLLQLSNIAFAFGQVAYARFKAHRPALHDRHVFALLYGGAVLVTGAFSLVTTNYATLAVGPRQLLSLAYLGVIASGICFFAWNKGATRVNPGLLAVMNNLKIPLAIVASLVWLRESTDYTRLVVGCALMAAALAVNEKLGVGRDGR